MHFSETGRRLRGLIAALLLMALIASGCSSSGDTEVAAADGDAAPTPSPAAAATQDEGGTDPTPVPVADDATEDATSIPVPSDDEAADDAIAGLGEQAPEPAETARGFVRNRFNIDPTETEVDCLVAESTGNAVLEEALVSSAVALGQIDDAQVKELSVAVNACVNSTSLGDWATQATGAQGDVLAAAPACFAGRFDDPERGDAIFSTFVALTGQFRIDQDGVPDITDAFVECAPITGLTDFIASETERQSAFSQVVDRDCLTQVFGDPEASDIFWSALIEGLTPPIASVSSYVAECTEVAVDPNEGLSDSIPADFVAWSGTGALSNVTPSLRNGLYDAPPPMTIDPTSNYTAVIATGGGEVRISLFADTAPITVNSFVNLARDGFYDRTFFHRVIDGFMAQGGDPTGSGTGGPGYSFVDEFEGGRSFDRKGLLAMANAGPATNGSQFFITFVPTENLTGAHTIFGEVVSGIEIVDAIQRRDPAQVGSPAQLIDSITIVEG